MNGKVLARFSLNILHCGLMIHCINTFASETDQIPEDVILKRNIAYREGDSQAWVLDLAMPKNHGTAPRAAIVVIHGGGWLEGDKSSFSTPTNKPPGNIIDYARLGIVAVTINYRLSKESPFPAALHDCKCAIRWLRANSEKYHIDPERIGAWGNSAGGHLALLLGMTADLKHLEGDGPYREFSSDVKSVVTDSGPIDLAYQFQQNQIRGAIELFLGGPLTETNRDLYETASPSSHVSKSLPPMLLIYGGKDSQVGVETADRFVVELDKAGHRDVTYLRLADVDHCPHSLIRVPWVSSVVNEFFVRTLK